MLKALQQTTDKYYKKQIIDSIFQSSPYLQKLKSHYKEPTKWESFWWSLQFRWTNLRIRLGEIIAGQKFYDE